jgi:flagella basal body P-ring formation protein FlgA
VEELTGVVDARLEAVALEPAVMGAHFKARLRIGGKVVRAVAVSPGHASFAAEGEIAP